MKTSSLPNKFKLSDEAYTRLKLLKAKTGMEDWTLARLGLCFSLGDSNARDLSKHTQSSSAQGAKEFNRYTLTGDMDLLYTEAIRSYAAKYVGSKMSDADVMKAHLNRGIIALSRQIKLIADIAQLMASKAVN